MENVLDQNNSVTLFSDVKSYGNIILMDAMIMFVQFGWKVLFLWAF